MGDRCVEPSADCPTVSKSQEIIGLVDGDNFYVSCHRLFEPRLRGRPVVVLSNNDLRGGNR
ncbi:hypothetical protein [Pseudomonas baetica]|uniref:Y-family DNA polymerase n=1 Tax=Pseudomonas baetica TaxID=674054 RepID=UPI003217B1F0